MSRKPPIGEGPQPIQPITETEPRHTSEIVAGNAENNPVSQKILDHLTSMHKTLGNDYRTPDGKYCEHCGIIAYDIARLLLAEGHQPYIVQVIEDVHEYGYVHPKTITPKRYEGRVTWTSHQVCCCEGIAYDPVIGHPIPIEQLT